MERRKLPVLTSPWKMGFFVSLMLLVVSAGVVYFFFRTENVQWAVPQVSSLASVDGWKTMISADGILFRLWPLLALVGLTSFFSFLLITQAVRKYKGYLDSGFDYKNLLATIQQITDIEDDGQIEKLKNHPNLKKFLLNVRETVKGRQMELDRREKSLVESTADLSKNLTNDCKKLVEAIDKARADNLFVPVDVELNELKVVEEAIETLFQSDFGSASSGAATDGPAAIELQTANDAMRQQIGSVTAELEQSTRAVKEIERELGEIRESHTPVQGSVNTSTLQKDVESLSIALNAMTKLTNSLGLLSEDAKSVAINTALHAGSGKSTQEDLIQLADDVKDIATKFGNVSKSYADHTSGMTGAIKGIESNVGRVLGSMEAASASSRAIGSVAGKASLLAERVVVLSDKLKSIETVREAAIAPEPAATDQVAESDDLKITEFGFETAGADVPLRADHDEETAARGRGIPVTEAPPAEESVVAELEPVTPESEMGDPSPESSVFQEISNDEGMFTELSDTVSDSAPGAAAPADEAAVGDLSAPDGDEFKQNAPAGFPETFIDIPERQIQGDVDGVDPGQLDVDRGHGALGESVEDEPLVDRGILGALDDSAKAPASPVPEAVYSPGAPDFEVVDGFESGDPARQPDLPPIEPAEDALDLYELGAVEYNPAIHG